ncbi:MAG: hypothetical protein PVJ67_05420 [Candidatus Pacearchaeota archaeon]|jgi:hypothetical protein
MANNENVKQPKIFEEKFLCGQNNSLKIGDSFKKNLLNRNVNLERRCPFPEDKYRPCGFRRTINGKFNLCYYSYSYHKSMNERFRWGHSIEG